MVRRTFNPEFTARYGRPTFTPTKLVKYSPKWQISRLMNYPFRGSRFRPRMLTVVIAMDGGAYINDRTNLFSRGAWAVYFGPGCVRNQCGTLGPQDWQTSGRAELEALRRALVSVKAMKAGGESDRWREIIIKTDSEYVYKTFNYWVWNWEVNGYTKTDGEPVEHAQLIQNIHYTIRECETELNLAIRLWKVGRAWNKEADAMVQDVLESVKGERIFLTAG